MPPPRRGVPTPPPHLLPPPRAGALPPPTPRRLPPPQRGGGGGGATRAQRRFGATLQSLLNKTQFIHVEGGEMYVRGTNLHIENGLGATNGSPAEPFDDATAAVNGRGNLIVGYNASRAPFGGPTCAPGL